MGKKKYTVVEPFRDINDYNVLHEVGADVSHFDKKRLENLVERGLVKEEEDPEAAAEKDAAEKDAAEKAAAEADKAKSQEPKK